MTRKTPKISFLILVALSSFAISLRSVVATSLSSKEINIPLTACKYQEGEDRKESLVISTTNNLNSANNLSEKNNNEIRVFISKEEAEYILLSSARDGKYNLVEFALIIGADVDARGRGGFTALIYAAKSGCLDIAKLLIEYGANVNAKTIHGDSALGWALGGSSIKGRRKMVELLQKNNVRMSISAKTFLSIYKVFSKKKCSENYKKF